MFCARLTFLKLFKSVNMTFEKFRPKFSKCIIECSSVFDFDFESVKKVAKGPAKNVLDSKIHEK